MKQIILIAFLYIGVIRGQSLLISPANNSYSNLNSNTFVWNQVNNATAYQLDIALDQAFSNIIISRVQTSTSSIENLATGKTYFWRVSYRLNSIWSAYSSPYRLILVDFNNIPNKSLWLDAGTINQSNNSAVSLWTDISGNGKNATQTNASWQPKYIVNGIGGKPSIQCKGGTYVTCGNNFTMNGNFSFIVLFKAGPTGTFGTIFAKSINANGGIYLGHTTDGTFNMFADVEQIQLPTKAKILNKNLILSGVFKTRNDTVKLYRNNILDHFYKPGAAIDFAGSNTTAFDIGTVGGGLPLDGQIAELFIFNEALSDTNRNLVENYLMSKYAPSVNLGADVNTCLSSYNISANQPYFEKYLWSNGDTMPSITVSASGSYSVRATDIFGRFSFDTLLVTFDTINYKPDLGADTSICFGQNSVLNAGPKHLNYLWNTGDTSNTLSINQTGFYSVSVKNCKNNTFRDTVYLFVSNNKPNLADTGILCFNAAKTLNPNIPNQALTYLWSNGDTNKTISIQNGGVYYLQVKDTFNCTFNDTITIYTDSVLKNTTLGPNLNLCSGNTIGLISENFVKSYLWNNGSAVNRIQVNASGDYWVKVADSNACSISDTLSVTIIGNAPQMKLAVSKVCTNEFTSFKDLSIPPSGNTIVSQFWRFTATDSSLNGEDSFRFGTNGNKGIYHRVTTNVGCFSDTNFNIQVYNPPSAGFSSTTSCAQTNSFFVNKTSFDFGDSSNMWMWSFGDGQNSSIHSPAIKYVNQGKFSIQLIAISKRNCRDTAISELDIYPAFVAKFKTENNCQSDSTLFIDSTMSKSTVYWMWNFGDNSFSMERNPKHRYMNGGVYNVLMAVQNAIGCRDTLREAVTIVGRPKANIISGNGCYRDAYNFEESSIVGIGDSIVSYRWEISNAGVFDVKKPNYAFRDTGMVSLKLTISTKFGCSDTMSKKIQILPSPIAGFSLSANAGELPAKIFTTNLSKNASSYLWKFGNNDSSTEISPTYTYFSNGDYTIRLIAMNGLNCKDVYELPFIVKPTQVDLLVDKLLIKEVRTADSALYYEMSIRLINIGSRPIYDIDLAISSLQRPDVIEHWRDTLMPSTNKTYILNTRINAASSIYRNYICIEGKNVNFNQKESNVVNNKTCETVVNDIQMNIYPNPASTIAEILMVLPADGIVSFSLMDYRGKDLLGEKSQNYKKGFNSFKFDVSQLQRGMYFLRMDYSGNSKIVKFEVGE
ncbi:MAG: PKD domain-containing protein [Chitinophagales bacterium]|nr:PKD domain-containing protein [Chitinophagales bacterium]